MAISVNGVNALATAVSGANADCTKLQDAQNLANQLVNSKLFNVGSDTSEKPQLEENKARLEAELKELQDKIAKLEEEVASDMTAIERYQDELNTRIKELIKESENLTEDQEKEITKAQNEVIEEVKKGQIDKKDFSSRLSGKIIALGFVSATQSTLEAKLTGDSKYQELMQALSSKINDSTSLMTTLRQQASLTSISLNTVNALLGNMTESKSIDRKYGNGKQIYTPQQVDLVDFLSTKYGKGANNSGLAGLGQALNDNVMDQMFNAGFNKTQAAYTMSWMFPDSGISYNSKTSSFTVPYGHSAEETATYSKLVSDLNSKQWVNSGKASIAATTATGDVINLPLDEGERIDAVENEEEDQVVDEDRVDPIGFNLGNISFDFVVDANGDNIFNGSDEFLGAAKVSLSSLTDGNITNYFGAKFAGLTVEDVKKYDVDGDGFITGIEELLMYDSDSNGKIEAAELDDLWIVKTNWGTGAHSFTNATEAGVGTIDLSKFQTNGAYDGAKINQENWLDINNNLKQNSFGVNMADGSTLSGYQRLDNKEYIQKVYGDAFGKQYTINFNPLLDAAGNLVELEVKEDSTAKDSARASVEDAKEALEKATAELEEQRQAQDEKATTAVNEANAARINFDSDGIVYNGQEITTETVNQLWGAKTDATATTNNTTTDNTAAETENTENTENTETEADEDDPTKKK